MGAWGRGLEEPVELFGEFLRRPTLGLSLILLLEDQSGQCCPEDLAHGLVELTLEDSRIEI